MSEGNLPPALLTEIPGPKSRALSERATEAECPAFDARRQERARASGEAFEPVVYHEGLGANVWDVDGNRFVDFVAGFGALGFGHRPAFIEHAVHRQSAKLGLALGDVYASDVKVELLEQLRALHPDPKARVMLGLSGADAVTAALKTALLATGKPGVVAFDGAYHGLSHGPLAACGLHASFRRPFASQTGEFVTFAPYPGADDELESSLGAVERALATDAVGALLVEPILGRGGVIVPPSAFLPALERLCRKYQTLLIADEIWTGLGRSGAPLESIRAGASPDLICIGKALGGGHAISACIGSGNSMAGWAGHGGTTLHTATHFGSPVACAAALAVLERIRHPGFLADVEARGLLLRAAIQEFCGPLIREVRGRGLMLGVELASGSQALATMRRLLNAGYIVLTGGQSGSVLTLTPALSMNESMFEPFAHELARALDGPPREGSMAS